MDRVKTKTSGSDSSTWVFDFHKVSKWIQDFFEENIKKYLRRFFTTPGVFFYGSQNNLKCSGCVISAGKYSITIEAGSGITGDGDMIIIPSQIIDSSLTDPGNNTTRYLYLHHLIVNDNNSAYDVVRIPDSYAPVNVHEKDSYELKMGTAWPTGQELIDSIKIAKIVQDGAGSITVTDERVQAEIFSIPAAAWKWINDNYASLNKSGTTATDFRVDTANKNLKVLTQPGTPVAPLNLRIYDINPVHESKQSNFCNVTFKWNWEALTGAHDANDAANTIRITGVKTGDYQALNVTQDQLVGFRLYSPSFQSADQTYLITGNAATTGGYTVITLESSYNNESVTENCSVVCNAKTLSLLIIPYSSGNNITENAIIHNLDSSYITDQTYTTTLPMLFGASQASYNVKLKAIWLDEESAPATMGSGSYDPDHVGGGQSSVSYNAPFQAKLPMLDDTGASLTLTPTTSGFNISISPGNWEVSGKVDQTAHEYEIIRTTLSSVDWSDYVNSIRWKTMDKFIDIPTSTVRLWQVGVRPLQNNQVVGTPITGSVTSGAMGVAPGDTPFLTKYIDVRTYSGSMTGSAGGPWTLSTIKTPSGSATAAQIEAVQAYLHQAGSHQNILTDSAGHDFIIDPDLVHLSGSTIVIEDLVNLAGANFTPAAGNFTINTSERARRVAVLNNLQIEYNSVKAYFDSDILQGCTVGNKGVIRVCQNSPSGKVNADILNIWENDTGYDFNVDFTIRQSYGNMGLLVDVWDPAQSGANNTCSIRGLFTLYMRPHITTSGGSGTQS